VRRLACLPVALPFVFVCILAAASCGGSSSSPAPSADAASLGEILDAPCLVTEANPPDEGHDHVPVGTRVDYGTNPPSSGNHYPVWAAYQAYTTPVPRPYYVHNLEHGAIVLLYRCEDAGGCPDIARALQQVSDSLPDDPLCTQLGEGVRVRTVIAPDLQLDVPIAAAAWDWTYRAQCLDLPSLKAFARQHYGQGREPLCNNGMTTF
jgi:hypothetical protein